MYKNLDFLFVFADDEMILKHSPISLQSLADEQDDDMDQRLDDGSSCDSFYSGKKIEPNCLLRIFYV